MMVAQVCRLKPGTFVHTFGDLHLYSNHLDQARLQLTRAPRPLPQMRLNPKVQNIHELPVRGLRAERLRPLSGDQGADCGLIPV